MPPEPDPSPDANGDVPRIHRGPAQDNLHALAKDVQAVTTRAQVLGAQALRAQQAARAARARPPALTPHFADARLTVPEACLLLGICERTLRLALRAPELAERMQSGTRKAGTFYKAVRLLPADLVADLVLRFPKKNAAPSLE